MRTNIRILLIEDDPLFALEVEMLINKLGFQFLGTIGNSDDALQFIREKQVPDLLLIDVFVEGTRNGIELAEAVQEFAIPTIMMTVSNDEQLYKTAQKIGPIAYIVKPFDLLTLRSMIDKAIGQIEDTAATQLELNAEQAVTGKDDHLYIKQARKIHKVALADILFLHSEGNYCVVQSDQKKFIIKISMTRMAEKLTSANFIQVHRGYMVNLDKVEKVDLGKKVVRIGDAEIPVGKKFRPLLIKRIKPI